MHWFTFKNKSSKDNERLIVNSLGYRKRAEEEVTTIAVPRSNRFLSISHDSFKPYKRKITITTRYEHELQALYGWLRGEGRLETSLDRGVYFRARVLSLGDPKHVAAWLFALEVTFLVDPLAYLVEGDEVIEHQGGTLTLVNPGTYKAAPLITLYGTGGSVTVNGKALTVTPIQGHVTIDSERLLITKGAENKGQHASGSFPIFPEGESEITLGAGLTRAEIVPRWRKL